MISREKSKTEILFKPFYLALIVGFALKIYFLFAVRFHVDELIHSWIHYVYPDVKQIIDHVTINDVQMPLFFVLSKLIFPLNNSFAWLLRLPWFFFVLFGSVFFYIGLVKNFSSRTAHGTLMLLALSAPQLIISTSFRPYALFLGSSLLFYYHLFFWLEGSRENRRICMLFFFLVLMSLTHYFGFLLSLMFIIYFSRTILTDKRYYLPIIVWSLCVYPFVGNMINDFGIYHDYRDPIDLRTIYNFFSYYSFGAVNILLGLLFFYLYVYKEKKINNLKSILAQEKIRFSLFLVGGTYILAILKSLVSSPVFEARYFLHLAPLYYLLVSEVFTVADIKLPVWSKYLLIVFMSVFSFNQIKVASNGMEHETYNRFEEAKKIYRKNKNSYFVLSYFRGCPLALFRQAIAGEHLFCEQFFRKKQFQQVLKDNGHAIFYRVDNLKISEFASLPGGFPENIK